MLPGFLARAVHHLALHAHEWGEVTVRALHERFDRLERLMAGIGERE